MLRVLPVRSLLCVGVAGAVSEVCAGQLWIRLTQIRVTVVDASVGHILATLSAQNVYELGFSPRGTYIITWQRPSKDDNGDAVKNLKVWRVVEEGGADSAEDEHNVVGRFVQKSQTGWNLQYTFDERYCARVVTNEVQFYQSDDLGPVWNKLRVEGVTDFAVSPGENYSIAVFVPERKVDWMFCLKVMRKAKNDFRANLPW